jgi:hypothetical protein
MAKKTRRPNLSQETLERARRELSMAPQAVETPVKEAQPAVSGTARAAAAKRAPVAHADLSTEYAYVILDLRNMAALAAAMMIVLVILSFFI